MAPIKNTNLEFKNVKSIQLTFLKMTISLNGNTEKIQNTDILTLV